MATKIFISSVYSGLEEIRQQIASFLTYIGHQPILFESSYFSKSTLPNMVKTCLQAVEEAHIYILLVSNQVGSIVPELGKSITHLELKKAISANKTIFVFVNNYIKKVYFKEFMRLKKEMEESEDYSNGRVPRFDEVFKKLGNISVKKEVLEIINEANQTVPWIYPFDNVDDIIRILRSELSSLLKSHVLLRNKKQIQSLDDIIIASKRFEQFDVFLHNIFPYIKEVKVTDFAKFTKEVQSNLKGGKVYHNEGADIYLEMLEVGNCEGTSLYRFDGKHSLIKIAASGLAGGRDSYKIDDTESHVAITFKEHLTTYNKFTEQTTAYGEDIATPNDATESYPQIFYRHNLLYISYVFGNYVFTLHFPIESREVEWETIMEHTEELYEGIMSIKANNDIMKVVSLFLKGGVKTNDPKD